MLRFHLACSEVCPYCASNDSSDAHNLGWISHFKNMLCPSKTIELFMYFLLALVHCFKAIKNGQLISPLVSNTKIAWYILTVMLGSISSEEWGSHFQKQHDLQANVEWALHYRALLQLHAAQYVWRFAQDHIVLFNAMMHIDESWALEIFLLFTFSNSTISSLYAHFYKLVSGLSWWQHTVHTQIRCNGLHSDNKKEYNKAFRWNHSSLSLLWAHSQQ